MAEGGSLAIKPRDRSSVRINVSGTRYSIGERDEVINANVL